MSEPTRRTLHGGHTIYPHWEDLGFTRHLSAEARGWFEVWAARTARLKDDTERALRGVLDSDARAYAEALEALRPGAGAATKLQLTIWLCKAAMHIHNLKRPDYASLPAEFRRRAEYSHGISLNWGPPFAERFTKAEAEHDLASIRRAGGPSAGAGWRGFCAGLPVGSDSLFPGADAARHHRRRVRRRLGARGVGRAGHLGPGPRRCRPLPNLEAARAAPRYPCAVMSVGWIPAFAGMTDGPPLGPPLHAVGDMGDRPRGPPLHESKPWPYSATHPCRGGEMADARDLKSRDFGRVGSTPTPGTGAAQAGSPPNSRLTRSYSSGLPMSNQRPRNAWPNTRRRVWSHSMTDPNLSVLPPSAR